MTNEKWNDFGHGVTKAEERDHNMTDVERKEALVIIDTIISMILPICLKMRWGAPCAAHKTLNDLDQAFDFISFVYDRVKDFQPQEKGANCE